MPETIKQEALQLEPVLESYRACKISHTFPMEKPLNYNPLKLPSLCRICSESVPSNNKPLYIIVANGELFPPRYLKGTVNSLQYSTIHRQQLIILF